MQQLVVILSTANFRFRPWTNKQWMASEYLKSRIPVVYIEPHGLRLPKCNYSDLKRIFSNLYSNRISRSAIDLSSQNPLLNILQLCIPPAIQNLPYFIFSLFCNLAYAQIYLSIRRFSNSQILFYSYHPFLPPPKWFLHSFTNIKSVLHLVDDLSSLPWIKLSLYKKFVANHFQTSDLILVTNPFLYQKTIELAKLHDISIVQDTNCFPSELLPQSISIGSIAEKDPNSLFMSANLSSLKVDFNILISFLNQTPANLVVAGPCDSISSKALLSSFFSHDSVKYLGFKSFTSLIEASKYCRAGIICQTSTPYNKSSTPMKFLDYISMGLIPCVRDMPFLDLYSDVICYRFVDVPSLIQAYLSISRLSIDEVQSIIQHNLNCLRNYTYTKRLRLIHGLLYDQQLP